VRRAYNHAQYMAERHDLMQWWSDYLDEQQEKASQIAMPRFMPPKYLGAAWNAGQQKSPKALIFGAFLGTAWSCVYVFW
jgi:hypothetical protein